MRYLIEATLVTVIVYLFVILLPAININKKPGLILGALVIGLLNAVLSFLTELPLTFTGYFLLSVFFRLAVALAVLKFIQDFFSWITVRNFKNLVIVSGMLSIFTSIIPFLLGT